MTRLEKINEVRLEMGLDVLPSLPDLETHCEECGDAFTHESINFGRCDTCGNMICATLPQQIKTWQDEV